MKEFDGTAPTWTGAVLAGGLARRFGGRDKAALDVGGRRILDRLLDAVLECTPHALVIANDRDRYATPRAVVLPDAVPGAGPLGGIYTALISSRTPRTLVVACDMPFVSAALLSAIAAAGDDADVVVPRTARRLHPLCASYSCRCAPHLRRLVEAGRLKVLDALDGLRVVELGEAELRKIGDPARLLANVNTEEDYRRILAEYARAFPQST